MKKIVFLSAVIILTFSATANAVNLMQAFQQALLCDPTYQQAISQRYSTREGFPISLSNVLPSANITTESPSIISTRSNGTASTGSYTQNGYNVTLNLSQTVFNFSQFYGIASARSLARGADATLSAAAQNLMIRVAQAYFAILQDQDTLAYIRATRTAFSKQLEQVNEQYKVGLKTITDVYTAQASYETSVANYIAAEATLANDKENLRAITGVLYPTYATLREDFPLIKPQPANIDAWVTTAGRQNWSVRSAQYTAQSYRAIIKQEFGGHIPTVTATGSYENLYYRSSGNTPFFPAGANRSRISSASLNFNIPLVQGGLVLAQTRQAKDNYQVSLQQLEYQLRTTLAQTRQNYMNVVAGISKISADKKSIQSNISSVNGMEAAYRVGTEILVNVLNQRESVLQAQQQYAIDRYAYVNNLLALKQAAGTLCVGDLVAINSWLTY